MKRWKVLIVNDSPVSRAILRGILETDKAYEVVGEAPTGREAVRVMAALRPDVILMDIHMPEMDGVQATRKIMTEHPTRILITSATITRNLGYVVEAQAAGAIDFIHTPTLLRRPGSKVSKDELRRAGKKLFYKLKGIRELQRHRRVTPGAQGMAVGPVPTLAEKYKFKPGSLAKHISPVVAIGASTGGPTTIVELLKHFRRPFPVPIVVILHIDAPFAAGFAAWVQEQTRFQTTVVRRLTQMQPGVVYVAPGGDDNLVCGSMNSVRAEPAHPDELHVPNIDALFNTLVRHHAEATCGIVLTGMGKDGAAGAKNIKEAGGLVVAQDPQTAIVPSMPQALIDCGATHHGCNLPTIGALAQAWADRLSRQAGTR